ncbi:MAG: ABC transporter ATP-binding protein, partial [Methanosarcinales archaeon]
MFENSVNSKLEVRNLDFYYNGVQILNQININADNGDFIGIIGANGSGKTTLLKVISRVLKPKVGCVFVDGKNINEMKSREIAKNIGVVPQNISINFDFSVEDIVLMGRTPYVKNQETIEDI